MSAGPAVSAGPDWGVTLPLAGLALREHRAIVEGLPDIGFSQVWTAEGGGIDAFTPLATAAWAPGLGLGTGIVPVFTRGPAVIAQTAATIAELSGAPLLLGVGASVPAHVTDINGIPFEEPYKRTRDVVRFLSRAFTGEVIGDGFDTFSITGFQLRSLPPVRPKVIVGALRPGMVRLGFRYGDGVVTNMLFAEDVPAVVAAAAPERRPGSELIVKVFVCPSADDDHARAAVRPFVTWILNQTPYHAFHEWLGRGELLRETHERWLAGDPAGAARTMPDAVVDEVFVHGSPERCRELIARYAKPGVTGIQLYVLSPPGAVRGATDALRLLAALRPSPVAVGA